MSYFEFPHTRDYDGDLGFIIKRLDELNAAYNNFFEYNTIKFHDPIEWNITETYPANNIVYDEQSETFYIAKQAVPAGIDISNKDYWLFLTPFKTDTAFSTSSINPIANKTVTNKFTLVDSDIASLNTRLAAEIATRTSSDATLSQLVNNNAQAIAAETTARAAEDTTINARIDEIIRGASVDPDAELLDIRVAGNGDTYSSAGAAVRAQFDQVNNSIVGRSLTFTIPASSGTYKFPVSMPKGYVFTFTNNCTNACSLSIYTSNDSTLIAATVAASASKSFIVPGEGYIKIGGYFTAPGGSITVTNKGIIDEVIDNIGNLDIFEPLNLLYASGEYTGGGVVSSRLEDNEIKMYTTSTANTQYFFLFNGDTFYKANNNTDVLTPNFEAGKYTYKFEVLDKDYETKRVNVQLVYTSTNVANYVKIADINDPATGTFTAANDFIVGLRVYNNVDLGTVDDYTIVKFSIYAGEHEEYPYFPRFTAIDSIARMGADDSETLPAYYFNNGYIQDKAKDITDLYTKSVDLVKFGFVTDYHVPKNTGNTFKLLKYLDDHTESIPFVIFGGDVVGDVTSINNITEQARDFIRAMSDFDKNKVLQCRGNHDYLGVVDGNPVYLDYATRYNFVMGNQEKAFNNGKMYYYYDVPNKNTRIIVIDDYDGSTNGGAPEFSQTEIDWIVNTALDCENKNIIFVTHNTADPAISYYTSNMEPLMIIMTALKTRTAFSNTVAGVNINVDFTGDNNTLVCCFCGHGHNDESHTTSDGVLSIMTNCDGDMITSASGYDRTPGTVNEQCFDIITIDIEHEKIYATRIGAGIDREWTY